MKFYHVIALILWVNIGFTTESTSAQSKDLDLILSYYDQYASDAQPNMKDLKEEDYSLFLRILKHPHVPTAEKEFLIEKMIGIGTRSLKNYTKWVKEPLYPFFEQSNNKRLAVVVLKRLGNDDIQKKLSKFKVLDEVNLLAISISYRERDINNFLDPLISEAGYYLAHNLRTNHPLHAQYFIKKVPFKESDFFLQFNRVFDLDSIEEPVLGDLLDYLIELIATQAKTTSSASRLIDYLEVIAKRFPQHRERIKKSVTEYFKAIDNYYTMIAVEKNLSSILAVLGVDNFENALKIKKSELLNLSQAPFISAGAESALQTQEVEDVQLAKDEYWESLATPDQIGQYHNEVKIRLMRPAYQSIDNQVNLAKRIERYAKLIQETENKKKSKYYEWILSLLKNAKMENSVARSMRELILGYYKTHYSYELDIRKNYKGELIFTQDGKNPQPIMALANRTRYFEGVRYRLLKNEDELKSKFLPKIDEILTNSSFPDAQYVALSFYSDDIVFESLGKKNIQGIQSECSDEYCGEGGLRDKVIEIYRYWIEKFKTADVQRKRREIGFFDQQYTQPRKILREAVLILAKLTEQKDEKSRRFLSEIIGFERSELFSAIPGRTLDSISNKITPQVDYLGSPSDSSQSAEPARQR